MSDSKLKKMITRSCSFSKIINAPLRFVYSWCTDYREDDYKLTGGKSRRFIIEKTKNRAVYITKQKGARGGTAVNIVMLSPPDRWYLNSIGDQRNETAEYHLRKLGQERTKLNMLFKHRWKKASAPTRTENLRHLKDVWGKYAASLERDYQRK